MKRVALHSLGDVGRTMSGPGIRYFHLAQELARRFDVTLLTPNEPDVAVDGVEVRTFAGRSDGELARDLLRFDAVVAQRLPEAVMRRLARSDVRTVYDLYVPLLSEHLAMLDVELDHPASIRFHERAMLAQRLALATGNAFVCASERQRDFWLGMLAAAGRVDLDAYREDPTLRALIDVVPFGLPTAPPASASRVLKGVHPGIAPGDRVLLWGGGVWNWFDPLTVIRAVETVAGQRDDVKLLFLGLRHPQVPQMAMAARALELAESRGLLGRTVFANHDWISYEERGAFLLEADVGVSAHFDSLEARYAFRTRLLDYFWAGLPTITTRGDVLGDLVAARGLGRSPDAGDVAGWARAIEELLEPDAHAAARRRVETVRGEYTWPRVAEPLGRLVAHEGTAVGDRAGLLQLRAEELLLRLRTSYEIRGARGFLASRAARLLQRARAFADRRSGNAA